MTHEMMEWAQGTFTKITCQVASEEELLAVHRAALAAGLPVALVQDAGKTEFHGVPTYTCLAVGPANAKDVDEVTGHLKLY
jgi:PTH2 family peptidyl-tRNA hydrolase